MSAGRYVFFGFFFLFGCLGMAMMFGGTMSPDDCKAEAIAPVLTELEQRIEGAYSRGATLFQYKRDVPSIALCNGRTRLFNLDTSIKEFRLTSQEAANLCLCKLDSEGGGYYTMQDIPGTLPGDYLMWDEGGLHDKKYSPR